MSKIAPDIVISITEEAIEGDPDDRYQAGEINPIRPLLPDSDRWPHRG
jgi:hypothetical protein